MSNVIITGPLKFLSGGVENKVSEEKNFFLLGVRFGSRYCISVE